MTTPTQEGSPTTLWLTPLERALLDKISEQEGRTSKSAIMRKLIVEDCVRRNIDINAVMLTAGQQAAAS